MDAKTYLKVSTINLVFLAGGIWIGHEFGSTVHAQSNYEEVVPVISAGTAAFGTLLSGRLAADEITVHGIDLLKLHEGTLNLVARKTLTSPSELQVVIDAAKVARPLHLTMPELPKPAPKQNQDDNTKKDEKK